MPKSYSSREILRILQDDGWVRKYKRGDHLYLKHPTKPGKVTVTHPKKDVPIEELYSILHAAGLPKEIIRQTDRQRNYDLER